MPEGDTIHSLARVLRASLVGHTVRDASCRVAAVGDLTGRRCVASGAVGKHLLLRLDDDSVLRVHLGLHGRWLRRPLARRRRADPDALGLELVTDAHQHLLLRHKALERLPARHLPSHPVLRRLGPDLSLPAPDLSV